MEFIEAPAFDKYLSDYLDDDDYRRIQAELAVNPELGDMMPGTGGFRKMRWADTRRGKGRRGGLRIIYFHFKSDHQIWFLTVYDKSEASDLTSGEKKTLKAAIEKELESRAVGREARHKPRRHGDGKERHL
jgi:hypothetical protein